MFQSARLKLTAWYLVIIMTITVLFSIALYKVATQEVQRAIARQEFLMQTYEQIYLTPPPGASLLSQLQDSEQRLKAILIVINGWIFLVAGTAAYFLAGRTLSPIRRMLDEQNRFISDASHELKTPLTAERTELEVALRDKKLTLRQAKQILQSNLEEVVGMQALSANLLRLTQSQQRGLKPIFTQLPLQEVVSDAIKKLSPLAKAQNIEVSYEEKPILVMGERGALMELFVILLDNAIKYSYKDNKIEVIATKKDHRATISIKDYGTGITKEDLPHIYDRFYRAEKSRSKNEITGYGLGLAIAKKTVSEHKGTINVLSELGKGTTFTVMLPTI